MSEEEKIIEDIKEIINRCKECKFATCEQCEINWTQIKTIDGILDLYNKQKEINQYNDKEIKYLNCCIKSYEDNYISKDKIREKIEKLQSELKYIGCENKDDIGDKSCKKCFNSYRGANFVYCYAYHQIKVLKELLKEE